MAVTTRHGVKTRSPSWKVVACTAAAALTPVLLDVLSRKFGWGLTDGNISIITGVVVFVTGYQAPPQGIA